MGVLGWTEQEVVSAHMQAVVAALKGRNRLIRNILESVFGPAQENKPKVSAQPGNLAVFDALFGVGGK